MSKRTKARELALQGLYQYEIANVPAEELVTFHWIPESKKINSEILLFAEELISGTIKNISIIDETIKLHIDQRKFEDVSPVERSILRFSIYSLLFQKEIPFNVIINEAINLSRKFGSDNSYRFINGVLDSVVHEITNN